MSADKSLRYEEFTKIFLPETYKKGYTDRRLSYFLNIVYKDPRIIGTPLIAIKDLTTRVDKMKWTDNKRNPPKKGNEDIINPEFVAFFLKMAVECHNKNINGNDIISILSSKPEYTAFTKVMLLKIIDNEQDTQYVDDLYNARNGDQFINLLKNHTFKCTTAIKILHKLLFDPTIDEIVVINKIFLLILFNDMKRIFKYNYVLYISDADISDNGILIQDNIYYKYKNSKDKYISRYVINGDLKIDNTTLQFYQIRGPFNMHGDSQLHELHELQELQELQELHAQQYGESDQDGERFPPGGQSRAPTIGRAPQPPPIARAPQPQTIGQSQWPQTSYGPTIFDRAPLRMREPPQSKQNDKQYFIGGGRDVELLLGMNIESLNKTIEHNKNDLSIIISKSKLLKLSTL